jgi:prepilin-type N-terminal cleavage/methylation domain-containing protein/prepilin-type processing-associated H-X9-DG protein
MNKRGGFTLIELLVVIVIVAILAAILFPVFMSARNRAHQAACLSNVRQLALAFTRYCDDHKGRFTPYAQNISGGHLSSEWVYWMENIQPYVRNERVFVCPARPKGKFSIYWLGYGFNYYYLGSPYVGQPGYTGILASSIKTASKTVFLADSRGRKTIKGYDDDSMLVGPYGPYIYSDIACPYNLVSTDPDKTYQVSDCHNGGANVAWCDGHAGWMIYRKIAYDITLWDPRLDK